jgi:peroxiredoxin
MQLATDSILMWTFATVVFLTSGCTPPEPQVPAPNNAAPEATPAQPQAAEPAPPQAAPRENAAAEGPQLVPPTTVPHEPMAAAAQDDEPQRRTAFYRADSRPAEIPPVMLSKSHEGLCRVKVGDTMPEIVLPRIGNADDRAKLAELFGVKATVVVFWTADRRMAREQLADLPADVIKPFGDHGVAVVGIAVEESPESAASALQQAGAKFPNLLDRDGEAFAKVGSDKLPRTYLLDANGKILWFDIEYSLTTRRELHEALRAVTE